MKKAEKVRVRLETGEVVEAAVSVPEFNGWYCAQCQCGVAPSEVTYQETHTTCGRYITDDEPPTSPQRVTEQDAAAIYESAVEHYKYTQSFNRLAWLHMSGRALLAKLNGVTE